MVRRPRKSLMSRKQLANFITSADEYMKMLHVPLKYPCMSKGEDRPDVYDQQYLF